MFAVVPSVKMANAYSILAAEVAVALINTGDEDIVGGGLDNIDADHVAVLIEIDIVRGILQIVLVVIVENILVVSSLGGILVLGAGNNVVALGERGDSGVSNDLRDNEGLDFLLSIGNQEEIVFLDVLDLEVVSGDGAVITGQADKMVRLTFSVLVL